MATFGKNLVEVGVSMVLRDEFSTNAGRISDSYSKLMNDMSTYSRGISMGVGKAFEVGTKMVGGMYEAYRHSAEVFDQIFLTSKVAGSTAKQQQELLKLAQEVNLRTPLSNLDITSGMKYLAMAGNSTEAIKNMIGPAAELASIFSMPLGGKGGVADLMTNIMATFGIASDQAGVVADMLGRAVTSANMSLQDLAQSLEYSGATFRNAGIDLKTAAAAIGVLGDQGIQASSAGTALANMIRYLTLSITGDKVKGANMIKALGLERSDLTDSYGNLKRLDELMSIMASHLAGLSGTARESVMHQIFGVRGQRASSALFQSLWSGADKMGVIMDKIDNSKGFTSTTIGERMETQMGTIEKFISSWDNLKTQFGTNIADIFSPVLNTLSNLLTSFTKFIGTGTGKVITFVGSLGVGVGLVLNGARLLWRTFRMVVTSVQLANTAANNLTTGISRANTGAAMLEGHLRTIVALLMQATAIQMGPGRTGTLPGGYRYRMGKGGVVTATIGGRNYSPGNFAGMYTPYSPKPQAPNPNPGAGAGAGSASRGMKLLKGLGKVGLGALGIFGGPWGIALSLGITALTYAVNRNSESVDKNTSTVQDNTAHMTASEFRAYYEDKFIEAVKKAINSKQEPMKLSISVNGGASSLHNSGDILDIDTWGIY